MTDINTDNKNQDKQNAIDDIFAYYADLRDRSDQSVIVEMLKELQEVNGFLTPELQGRAAEVCDVKPSFIQLLIRTYPSLKKAPYAHEITVCSGARCHAKGGSEIISEVKKLLRIGDDHLSADGKWLMKVQNCLKNCKTSPNMKVDGKVYRHLSADKVRDVLMEIKRQG